MVKHSAKIIFFILLLNLFCLTGCDNFWDFLTSTDLDKRLEEKNNFKYLGSRGGTTLSLKNQNDYSFIVITDTHIEDGNAWGLEKIANLIKNNDKIEFVVVLGDITDCGSSQDVNKFIEISNLFNVPCYPVIGNHDILLNNWKNWKDLIGSTNYHIAGNGINLFILDSANSFFGKQQIDWLESKIKNSSGNNFVFTHSNFFVNGINLQQVSDAQERARIVSILKNRCNIAFSGHSHERYINSAGNVQYITIEDYKSKKAYCIVTVKNSVVTYTFGKL
jgi:predicted phosphodiesterase